MKKTSPERQKYNLPGWRAGKSARIPALLPGQAFLPALAVCLALCLFFPAMLKAQDDTEGQDPLDILRDAVVETGVGRDYIPALFNPQYISVSDASLSMEDSDVVFVATFFPDGVRI